MTDASGFAKFMPGFDFLQSLVGNASSALPNVGQWIAPTLDPEELDKRINELRTVQFWLDQNSRMLTTTIQALEVQRMTLSTLRGMNVSMGDLAAGLQAKPAPAAPKPAAAPSAASTPSSATSATAPAEPPAAAVDPMLWWGSLTEQFSKLAADAVRQAADAAAPVAASMAQAANETMAVPRSAPPAPRKPKPATKAAGKAAPKRAAPSGSANT